MLIFLTGFVETFWDSRTFAMELTGNVKCTAGVRAENMVTWLWW